jgi:hypothetical protein
MTSLYLFNESGECSMIIHQFDEDMVPEIASRNGAASYLLSDLMMSPDRARNVDGVLQDVPRTPTTAELAAQARERRNRLLIESDWTDTFSASTRLGPTVFQAWMDYRQALRDVPSQPGFPSQIDWPAAP